MFVPYSTFAIMSILPLSPQCLSSHHFLNSSVKRFRTGTRGPLPTYIYKGVQFTAEPFFKKSFLNVARLRLGVTARRAWIFFRFDFVCKRANAPRFLC